MNKSAKFDKVKGYYDSGLWTAAMVRNAANPPSGKPWITAEEADEIIGGTAQDGGGSGE